jgi:hypothetical protein
MIFEQNVKVYRIPSYARKTVLVTGEFFFGIENKAKV